MARVCQPSGAGSIRLTVLSNGETDGLTVTDDITIGPEPEIR
jgi:hypothetical protein